MKDEALHEDYMDLFWQEHFRYLDDGNYTIDNSLTELCIRPMTVERKNSLFFCSKEEQRLLLFSYNY